MFWYGIVNFLEKPKKIKTSVSITYVQAENN
jgi:hypothetical protein